MGDGDPIRLTAAGIARRLRAEPERVVGSAAVAAAIGAAISRHRRARGMSQAALAEAVGCDPSAVARWEAGTRTPTAPRLVRVARALGCAAGALLPDETG